MPSKDEFFDSTINFIENTDDIDKLRDAALKLVGLAKLQDERIQASDKVLASYNKIAKVMVVLSRRLIVLCTTNGVAVPTDIALSVDAFEQTTLAIK
jgi:hypothetical protein